MVDNVVSGSGGKERCLPFVETEFDHNNNHLVTAMCADVQRQPYSWVPELKNIWLENLLINILYSRPRKPVGSSPSPLRLADCRISVSSGYLLNIPPFHMISAYQVWKSMPVIYATCEYLSFSNMHVFHMNMHGLSPTVRLHKQATVMSMYELPGSLLCKYMRRAGMYCRSCRVLMRRRRLSS